MEEFCILGSTGKVHVYDASNGFYCRFKSDSDSLRPLGKCKNYRQAMEVAKHRKKGATRQLADVFFVGPNDV